MPDDARQVAPDFARRELSLSPAGYKLGQTASLLGQSLPDLERRTDLGIRLRRRHRGRWMPDPTRLQQYQHRRSIMSIIEILQERNAEFAAHRFSAGLSFMPTLQTIVVGCVDPRVDPAHVLGLQPGEAIVIRNVGGRVTPATLQTMALLAMIPRLEGAATVPGMNLVVLHHTDCGITRLARVPDMLANYFGVASDDLGRKAVSDPRSAVEVDISLLKATPSLPGGIVVSGFVYDVTTGRLETVVAPAPPRNEQSAA